MPIFYVDVKKPSAAEVIAWLGTGSLIRWEYSASATSGFVEGGTEPLVAGVERYAIEHRTGTTYYYRSRYSAAAPASDADFSEYSDPWLAGSIDDYPTTQIAQVYTTPGAAKLRLGKDKTTADDILEALAAGINRDLNRRIGYFVGPASDTVRLYSGEDARIHCDGRRLYIRGGIRSLTGVRIADDDDGTLAAATLADFRLGPYEYDGGSPGEPYQYVEITRSPTGSYGRFPFYQRNVELTGTFGWSAVPGDLAELASRQLVRAYLARSTGQTDVVGSDAMGNALISRLWSQPDLLLIQHYRNKAFA